MDESGGEVEVEAPLAGAVVIGEGVMVVVEPFTQGHQADTHVLSWSNGSIIGLHTKHVGCRVYQPCEVENSNIAQD